MQKYILLAEDDEGIIQVVTMILENEGYTVRVATNEKEVQEALKRETPSLLLLDVSLGGTDGGALAASLKNQDETKNVPVIISSANTQTKEIAEKAKADGFLLKPFDIETLLTVVKKYS